MNNPALSFDNVTVRYGAGDDAVLKDVRLTLEAGERVALVGRNGSGKTTLLMSAVGLVSHEGEIDVCGKRLSPKTLAYIRDSIGFLFNVPEDQLLFPRVIDDVAFGLLRKGVSKDEAFDKALKVLKKLDSEHLAESSLYHLSHGQKQRIALAGALITNPLMLLLDEPTAGLDPPGKHHLAELLRNFEATMLIATHDLDFADQVCSRILMLEGGKIVFDGPDTDGVRQQWQCSNR